MAVKDVFRPGATNPSDPKKPDEKGEESYWEKRKKEKRAQREALEEEKMMEELKNPPPAPQPAFNVQGGVKLDIDPQRDTKEAREELRKQQEKSDEKIEKLTGDLDKTKTELQKSEITAAMKEMAGQFTSALKEMNERIAAVKSGADPAILATQFEALTKVAEKMGFQKSTPQIGDPAIQIEITKLNMESAQREREFQMQMQQRKEDWEFQKEKWQDEREARRAELAIKAESEKKKNEFWDNLPARLGGAMGQGMMASRGKVGRRVTEEATPEPKAPRGKQGHHVEAGWGDSGEVGCPSCGEPIAIGPTARTAVCANCGEKVPIRRTGEKPTAEEE